MSNPIKFICKKVLLRTRYPAKTYHDLRGHVSDMKINPKKNKQSSESDVNLNLVVSSK